MIHGAVYGPDTSLEWTTEIFKASFSTQLQEHPFQLDCCNLQHFAVLCSACSTMMPTLEIWSGLGNPDYPALWFKKKKRARVGSFEWPCMTLTTYTAALGLDDHAPDTAPSRQRSLDRFIKRCLTARANYRTSHSQQKSAKTSIGCNDHLQTLPISIHWARTSYSTQILGKHSHEMEMKEDPCRCVDGQINGWVDLSAWVNR